MFIGHYAAALAAKTLEPRAPLWTYLGACQLVDIGWSGLVMTGVEKVRIDPTLPGSPLDLYFMPFTHSLPGALLWSLAAFLVGRAVLRLPLRAAAFLGLAVFSHWVLDLIVHRPDLELWFGGEKVGLSLWNLPVPEMTLEIGLLALAGAAWAASRARAGLGAWPAILFLGALVTLQIAVELTPLPSDPVALGATVLAAYLLVIALASLVPDWLVNK